MGKTQGIAVGGSKIYGIAYDGKSVVVYDEHTMNPNPWKPLAFKTNSMTDLSSMVIDSIACGVDDSLFILDTLGIAYRYTAATNLLEKLPVKTEMYGMNRQ